MAPVNQEKEQLKAEVLAELKVHIEVSAQAQINAFKDSPSASASKYLP